MTERTVIMTLSLSVTSGCRNTHHTSYANIATSSRVATCTQSYSHRFFAGMMLADPYDGPMALTLLKPVAQTLIGVVDVNNPYVETPTPCDLGIKAHQLLCSLSTPKREQSPEPGTP